MRTGKRVHRTNSEMLVQFFSSMLDCTILTVNETLWALIVKMREQFLPGALLRTCGANLEN
jgi:hypothetical protein